ncbi:glycosyltransferase family 4 protein [Acinetobacter sp. ANC 7201]|uniref:glycosyltransferase family 4 protein n=1 Tax=Acinetobacter sp. ANC 7201 TaxID=3035288 RepID=UPI00279B2BE6|nr:glycosyltransferase family 4 protein [Acinetobacter sp. ANC 7201]WFP96563.1 glycosyltransferase family 4 protein [Acinetobacter sp. ANC 7201]
MERLNWHIADELSHDHETIILSHYDAKKLAPQNCEFIGIPLNPLPIFLIFAFFKTLLICLKQKPDILFAGSGLTAPIVVFWAKIFRKKSLVYIHGLDIATNHPIYNAIWIPFIRHSDQIIANSTPTLEICKSKKIPNHKITIIHPGVTYPPLDKNLSLIDQLKYDYNLESSKVLISVGRLTKRKALKEFVDLSLTQIIAKVPNTKLVIIGDTPSQALNKNIQSKEEILHVAKQHNIEDHIVFIGNISDDKLLSSWFYLADLHIFPVKHIPNDPEGFGMVAIEAASHGTPTIAFKTGGIVDAVENKKTGFLIHNDDYESFSKLTINILQKQAGLNHDDCKNFACNFSWKNLSKKLNNECIKN